MLLKRIINNTFASISSEVNKPSSSNEIVEEKSNRINLDTGAVYPELGKPSCMFINAKENRREFFATEGS